MVANWVCASIEKMILRMYSRDKSRSRVPTGGWTVAVRTIRDSDALVSGSPLISERVSLGV